MIQELKMTQTNKDKIAADKAWEDTLATQESKDLLDQMAEEALKEFESGKCTPLNEATKK